MNVGDREERSTMLCGMAAFKAYCGVNFWKERLLRDAGGSHADTLARVGRIGRLADLPPRKATLALVRQAMALNDEGVAVPRRPRAQIRQKRLQTAVKWMAAGKSRNWKYDTRSA